MNSVDIEKIIKEDAKVIEERLTELFREKNERYSVLKEGMRYSLFTGGKRVRPFLALEFSRAFCGEITKTALDYGCALECVHTYSLIHDDLPCMDDDDYRRGKLTNHKVFGEANALLCGDGLLTDAFGIIARSTPDKADTRLEAVKLLSEMAGSDGMVAGQTLDLLFEDVKPAYRPFLQMNALKTGCLIRTACILGALASGGDVSIADSYGKDVGLAFQIEDDILDEGEEGKTTFLTFMSVEKAKEKIKELTNRAKRTVKEIEKNGTLCAFADYLMKRTV